MIFHFQLSLIDEFYFLHSHYTQNSRSIIGSALKILVPIAMLSILNASPTIVEKRLFIFDDSYSNSHGNETDVLVPAESFSTNNQALDTSTDIESFNLTSRNFDVKNISTSEDEMSDVFQRLVDEHLIFNIIQVFTLTIVPAFMLIYYNVRIFQGVIDRQKLLIPRERIFNQQLKQKKKGKKKEYDLETTIEEWQKVSERTASTLQQSETDKITFDAIKYYPTIGTFKHTTDLLTLPVTLPGIELEEHCSSPEQLSSRSSLTYGASNKRQYEDKLAFENMVSYF